MAKRLLRREHIVAASLVGAVVVVVGFASGMGTRPGSDASAAPRPAGPEPGQSSTAAPPTTTRTRSPQGGSTHQPGGAVPVTTAPNLPPGSHHTGQPEAPTTPPTTSPPTTTTPESPCEPGFVPEAVGTLFGTLGRATEALGLVPSVVTTTALVLPDGSVVPEGTPLDQLLATCPATTPTTTTPTTTTPAPGHGG